MLKNDPGVLTYIGILEKGFKTKTTAGTSKTDPYDTFYAERFRECIRLRLEGRVMVKTPMETYKCKQ